MLCKKCGYYAGEEAIVCPACGELLERDNRVRAGGAQAIRQGKRAREEIRNRPIKAEEEIKRKKRSGASHATIQIPTVKDTRTQDYYDSMYLDGDGLPEKEEEEEKSRTFDRRLRPVYSDSVMTEEQAAAYAESHRDDRKKQYHMVNWMKLSLLLTLCVILLIIGGWLFLEKTDPGQRMMAKWGRDATSSALWTVGEELLNNGDIEGAIKDFEKAKMQDEVDGVVDVDGLLLLGNAYEAAGRTDDAADLYELIYTTTPSRSEAYENHIRILQARGNQGDLAKAGELMKLAYEKTGVSSFDTQRDDLLPAPPEVDLTAGYYESKKYIAITSYQGYDVYYTFDEEAELPSGGTLFTERVFLDEGIHTLRAVAVNGELVSDELKGIYKIIMPSPQKPRSSLAPATYKQRQKIRLKPGLDNENDDDIVIYYTIDGSSPDADSPIYTGEPFWLPGGRVTLKAVAVNKYGKVSNMLEVLYKIEAKPYPLSAYTYEDAVNGIRLYNTTMTDFQREYGEGENLGEIKLDDLDTECRKYAYSWGYAVMSKTKNGWVLAELYFTDSSTFVGPRGTKVGDTESYVIGKFRDMGQIESASGNRGLYSNDDGTGKIWVQEDGGKIIRYKCHTSDSHWWQLDYITDTSGIVRAIDMLYMP